MWFEAWRDAKKNANINWGLVVLYRQSMTELDIVKKWQPGLRFHHLKGNCCREHWWLHPSLLLCVLLCCTQGLHSFLSCFSCMEPGLTANTQGKKRHVAVWGGQFTVMTYLTNLALNWQICSSSAKCCLVCGAEFVVQFFLKYWRYLLSKWGY